MNHIRAAVEYAVGYMVDKHDLSISEVERAIIGSRALCVASETVASNKPMEMPEQPGRYLVYAYGIWKIDKLKQKGDEVYWAEHSSSAVELWDHLPPKPE